MPAGVAAQACVSPAWQEVQVSGAPIAAATSGRGMLNAWSRRRSTPM
jgi:hypothetical protein